MKTLTTLLLSIFLISTIYSQENKHEGNAYVSGYVGGGLLANDGGIIMELGISGGYQWNKYLGIGGSFTGSGSIDYFYAGFNGLSLQYRFKPKSNWSIALDYGYVLGHSQGNDAVYWEYIRDWDPFFKIHLGWEPRDGFTLGLGFVGLPSVEYEECINYDSDPDNCEPIFISEKQWSASGIYLSLGYTWN